MSNVVTKEDAAVIIRDLQILGKKIVFTNGCFDLLHVGHLTYLEQARQLGDFLVVAVNTDASVSQNKGPLRPIVTQDARARMVGGLKPVDLVLLFSEPTPIALLQVLKPDIHVKGGDYTLDSLPETPIVRAYGGDVKILSFVPGFSTTDLILKLQQ